jgi:prepilin-type N-terminal cleavage/methylation domain-containing protein
VKTNAKGMTLLEVMIAVAITSVVMSLAVSVVGSGVRLARQGEQTVGSNEAARTGMEMILRDLRAAGTPQGIWVTQPGGTPFLINSIFTQAGSGGMSAAIDDLWLVVPRAVALQANCTTPGSAAVVTLPGPGTLNVTCTSTFATTDILLVTNFGSGTKPINPEAMPGGGALITGVSFAVGAYGPTISYAESATPNFSSAPFKGGFQRGDVVMPVDLIRYQVRPNALTGRPELVRARGGLNSAGVTATAPFEVAAGAPEQRFPDVDDLQVAFGTGTPPNLTFSSAHTILFSNTTSPLAVRLSVVGTTPRPILDDHQKIQEFGPVTVEDHVPSPTFDGYRRSLYRRRVELLNMGAVNL